MACVSKSRTEALTTFDCHARTHPRHQWRSHTSEYPKKNETSTTKKQISFTCLKCERACCFSTEKKIDKCEHRESIVKFDIFAKKN